MKLCYVSKGRAFFADADPREVWGDDWNDAPYEHNAGWPYGHRGHSVVVAEFKSSVLGTPADRHDSPWSPNSMLSVEMINHGAAAWLFALHPKPVAIYAGATVDEVRAAVLEAGGEWSAPVSLDDYYARSSE